MSLDSIIITGDLAVFVPVLEEGEGKPPAIAVVAPVAMNGTGKTTIQGKPVCVQDDFKEVTLQCDYIHPPLFLFPGKGTLKIKALNPDQVTSKTNSGGAPLILKGSKFTTEFTVSVFAINQSVVPPQADTVTKFQGEGQFQHANEKIKAT